MGMKPTRLALAAAVTAALTITPSASSAPQVETSASQTCLWKHTTKSIKTRTFNTYPRIEMRRKVVRTVMKCGDERVVTKRRGPWKPVERDGYPPR